MGFGYWEDQLFWFGHIEFGVLLGVHVDILWGQWAWHLGRKSGWSYIFVSHWQEMGCSQERKEKVKN